MKFMFVSLFLISLIGFLSLSLFFDTHSINSQGETIPSLVNMSVKITSPSEGKQIPSGELTISGISSDTQNKNCIVFVDWNDLKPFQKVRAAGPGGIDDFSEWIFTYDSSYHEIIAGNNELTSKITCLDGSKSLTKWNSINVTGYSKNSSLLPVIQKNTTSLESTSKQLPLQTIIPGSNHNTTTIAIEQNTTSSPLSNVSSVEQNTTSSPLSNVSSVEQNTTSSPLSNVSSVEQNTTSSPLSNVSESAVEMVIPNESTENTNNSLSASPKSNSNLKSNQSTFGSPRIDLDEQQPQSSDEEESNNQTMIPPAENQTMIPPAENQTMIPPAENQTMIPPAENQQQQEQQQQPQLQPPTLDNQQEQQQQPQLQPPTLDNQQEQQQEQPQLQPPTLDNDTTGSTGSPSIEEKSPTEGLFPPFQAPPLFP
jgi:hypothetical protein